MYKHPRSDKIHDGINAIHKLSMRSGLREITHFGVRLLVGL